MIFAITTRWNAHRHSNGESMVEEILELGFDHIELGYDLRIDLVRGVKEMIAQGAIKVNSLHSPCPMPMAAPRGSPEIFTLADADLRIRQNAVEYLSKTIRFAAEIGAKAIVVHAGNVKMKKITPSLLALHAQNQQMTPKYNKLQLKLQEQRDKKVPPYIERLYSGLEQLLPVLEECDIRLGLENLPTWESIPTELEMEELLQHFDTEYIGYWHDIGHAQVRENMGFINHKRWLQRLSAALIGLHIHDVASPAQDHLMPGQGETDFKLLKPFVENGKFLVLEPTPRTNSDEIVSGMQYLKKILTDENEETL